MATRRRRAATIPATAASITCCILIASRMSEALARPTASPSATPIVAGRTVPAGHRPSRCRVGVSPAIARGGVHAVPAVCGPAASGTRRAGVGGVNQLILVDEAGVKSPDDRPGRGRIACEGNGRLVSKPPVRISASARPGAPSINSSRGCRAAVTITFASSGSTRGWCGYPRPGRHRPAHGPTRRLKGVSTPPAGARGRPAPWSRHSRAAGSPDRAAGQYGWARSASVAPRPTGDVAAAPLPDRCR